MTIQRAEDFSTKSEDPKRVPRKQKPRPRKEDKRKDTTPPTSPRAVVHLKPRPQPKPEVKPPDPTPKVPSQRILNSLENKYKNFDKLGYARAKDRLRSTKVEATRIAESEFSRSLSKYKDFEPVDLAEQMIIRAIRVIPVTKRPKAKVVAKEPKGPTQRQLEQIERTKALPPLTATATATTKPKGAPRTVPPRETYSDPQIVEDMLDEFLTLEENAALKRALCAAPRVSDIKRLLRTDESIEPLIETLKKRVASPRRVATYLDVAARLLIPVYKEQAAAAQRVAEAKAKERHEARIASAIAKAKIPVEVRRKEAIRKKPDLTPEDWRALDGR